MKKLSPLEAKMASQSTIAHQKDELRTDETIGNSSPILQSNASVTDGDLKFMIALLNYALFSCPVDGGIDMPDGTTATRSMVESLKERLQRNQQITPADLQFMGSILDYTLFACSVDSAMDIGNGVTADRERITDLKTRIAGVLESMARAPIGNPTAMSEPSPSNLAANLPQEPQLAESDLKALIAILDYSVFTCPDEGIEVADGNSADRETIENLKRQLEKVLAGRHREGAEAPP
jgi:hypothetical protein